MARPRNHRDPRTWARLLEEPPPPYDTLSPPPYPGPPVGRRLRRYSSRAEEFLNERSEVREELTAERIHHNFRTTTSTSRAPSGLLNTTPEPANRHERLVRRAATPPVEEDQYHTPESLIRWMIDFYYHLRALLFLCLFFWWIGRYVDEVIKRRQV